MKINLSIEADTPEELHTAIAGLAGAMSQVSPSPAAAKATRSKPAETSMPTPAAPAPAAPATAAASNPSADTAGPAVTSSAGPTVTTAAPPSETEAPVSEADIIAAANAAVEKLGPAGPAKIKNYIAANYKKADGTPGTLKLTDPAQRPALLAELQRVARGEITLP